MGTRVGVLLPLRAIVGDKSFRVRFAGDKGHRLAGSTFSESSLVAADMHLFFVDERGVEHADLETWGSFESAAREHQ